MLDEDSSNRSEQPPTPGFRTLSAQRKRERMRVRLMDAVLKVCSTQGGGAVIEDVLNEAQVSRGTFYAHFTSFHDAVSWAGQCMANDQMDALLKIFAHVEDPVARTAIGPQSVLARAAIDPCWGEVIARIDEFEWSSVFLSGIRNTIVNGQRQGVLRRSDVEALLDLNVGTLIQGVKTLRHLKRDRWDYILSQSTNLLLAHGLDETKAQAAALWAKDTLQAHGSEMFDWWREFQ